MLRSDADVGLHEERSTAALREAERLPGVDYAEPLLGMVCDLRHGYRKRRVAITGLAEDHRLTVPMTAQRAPLVIPDEGLVLARKLAEILGVGAGDTLEVTPVRGRGQPFTAPVTRVADTFLGLDCYSDIDYLSRRVGEAEAINAVQMVVNPARRDDLYRALKDLPNAQQLGVPEDARDNMEKTLAETQTATLGVLAVFAGMIAFAGILNNALVELGDHIREVSTFRVLGYTPGQVAAIFIRQAAVVSGLGIVLPCRSVTGWCCCWRGRTTRNCFGCRWSSGGRRF